MVTLLNTETPTDKIAKVVEDQLRKINCSAPGTYCSGDIDSINIRRDLVIFGKIMPSIFNIIVALFVWRGITMHLKRAKRENLMDFS